jgi:hypothetical protein
MKLPAIKQAVENYSVADLKKAEESLLNEEPPQIEIAGDDEGEQLTHCMAAIWIKEEMQRTGNDIRSSTRNYIERVRNSIN